MTEHHPFRLTRGAAGVKQASQICLNHPITQRRRFRSQQAFIFITNIDDVIGNVREAAGIAISNEHPCTAVFQGIAQFGLGMAGIERHYHQSAGRHTHIGLDIFMAIVGPDGDTVALLQPQTAQATHQSGTAIIQLRVGVCAIFVYNRGAICCDLHGQQ